MKVFYKWQRTVDKYPQCLALKIDAQKAFVQWMNERIARSPSPRSSFCFLICDRGRIVLVLWEPCEDRRDTVYWSTRGIFDRFRWKGILKSYPVFPGWNPEGLVFRNSMLQLCPRSGTWFLVGNLFTPPWCPKSFWPTCLVSPSTSSQHIPSRVSSLFRSREYLLSETPLHITKTWKCADIK